MNHATMSEERLTDEEIIAIDARASSSWCDGCGEPRYKCACEKQRTDSEIMRCLCRDLRQARADLAAETATRAALRTQEARVSGLLADAGVPVGDLVAGVAALVASRDAHVRRGDDALDDVDRLRARLAGHLNRGECPESEDDPDRDAECAACQAMGPAARKAGEG